MNYVLSFCKITGASKLFSRNFYLPLLKPLTPKDALRTFKITGKWLSAAKRQHYIPVLLNHTQKRSENSKDYGKTAHKQIKNCVYFMPILDPENNENHKILYDILNSKEAEGCYVYTLDNKNYSLVISGTLEMAIREGLVIDVLISQRADKIVVKLRDLQKIPLELSSYSGDDILYEGEGATTVAEEQNHHHGKFTMSIAQIFEDKERQEEEWEKELKKLLKRRKQQQGEGSKEWNEMLKASTANMDWKLFEVEAKKIIEHIEEPVVEIHIGMEVDDSETTKNVEEFFKHCGSDALNKLPLLKDIPDVIKQLGSSEFFEMEAEFEDELEDLEQAENKTKRLLSGVKVQLSCGKECFIVGQLVTTDDGDVFIPGQTIENEFGWEYVPGITVLMDNKPVLISGLIVGENDNKNPMFVPTESAITSDGQLVFSQTKEERTKFKPRKAPKVRRRKRICKEGNVEGEEAVMGLEEEIYEYESYSDESDYDGEEYPEGENNNEAVKIKRKKPKKKTKRRKVKNADGTFFFEYVEIDDNEEECKIDSGFSAEGQFATETNEINDSTNETNGIQEEDMSTDSGLIEELNSENGDIRQYMNGNDSDDSNKDPRMKQHEWEMEMERQTFRALDEKILELIETLEIKKTELLEKLEELRNLAVDKIADPVSVANIKDATEIASKLTKNIKNSNVMADVLLTVMRRVITFPDKNSINIENINNHNVIYTNAEENINCQSNTEKLKIILKTAMIAANNIFKNRPKDEVSAVKAIGAVLEIALGDKDSLIDELCNIMESPVERNEICVSLLKELTQKLVKNKIVALKSVMNGNGIKNYVNLVENMFDILSSEGNIIASTFKKIAKNNVELVEKVIELAKSNLRDINTESCATVQFQRVVTSAVKEFAEMNLENMINNSDNNDLKELIDESVGFARVLGYNDIADSLSKLPASSKLNQKCDPKAYDMLKRLVVIRSLAKEDYGLKAALKEIRKNLEFGKTNPRIRQLIRESACLLASTESVRNSKEIPAKLLEEANTLALEDFLMQRGGLDRPVLVSKKGKQAIVPRKVSKDVLAGKIPYTLIDDDSVTIVKPVNRYSKFKLNSDYDKKGAQDRLFDKKQPEKSQNGWAETPKRYDVRNRMRKLSNYNPRMVA